MLNADGRSYSFDERGVGYGRGEGSAVIVLKRLDDALRCGDTIRALICSSGVNSDGRTNGITLPNTEAQKILQRTVYRKAEIDPGTISYVEAHGTGTLAGDLAELQAIDNVFCKNRKSPLLLGSIKSNIGHLEAASGLAGLIKAVLILEFGIVPPNANFEFPKSYLTLNDDIKVFVILR